MDAFENLEVWKRSSRLCVELYSALALCRDAGFKDQVTRAAISVPSNIAEGYERDSKREFMRFLRIAKGSCGELRTQLYIGSRIGYIPTSHCKRLIAEVWQLSRMLHGLIQSVARTEAESET